MIASVKCVSRDYFAFRLPATRAEDPLERFFDAFAVLRAPPNTRSQPSLNFFDVPV
jgi:hypothetical protein